MSDVPNLIDAKVRRLQPDYEAAQQRLLEGVLAMACHIANEEIAVGEMRRATAIGRKAEKMTTEVLRRELLNWLRDPKTDPNLIAVMSEVLDVFKIPAE